MTLYTVHLQKYGVDPYPDVRVVKEGFNWVAFIFTAIWALVKGYWWVAGGLFLLEIVLSALLAAIGLDLFGQAVVNIAFNLLVGIYANDLARWTLARRGYIEEDVVSGASQNHALERYVASLQLN
jgi:uncharacterized protein DUF2628